jgi:hypothetical protein
MAGPRNAKRTLASLPAAEFPAAAADLGGSHFLYVVELAGSIVRGRDVVTGTTIVDGRALYRIRLGRARPLVELLVDRETLRPVIAHYRSQRLEGWSRLDNTAPRRFLAADTPVERGC